MAEAAIRDQIKRLVSLQAIDTQIYRFRKEREDQPRIIAELEKNFQAKKAGLKELEDNLKALTVKRKDRELTLAAKEEEIKKAQSQLYQLKTNKEYQAKLTEIQGFNADKSVLEEEILKVFDEIDVLKAQTEKENARLKEEEGVFQAAKKKAEERIKELDFQLSDLEAKRKQVIPELGKKILANYERVLKNRDGLALVAVKDYACQGCFINVPPQVVNEIKKHDRIVVCEKCSRILYLEEDI